MHEKSVRPTERGEVARLVNASFDAFMKHHPDDGLLRTIRTTSGTTGGQPMMFVREYSGASSKWFSGAGQILACFGSMQVRLNYALYFRHAPGPARMLVLDGAEFTAKLTPLLEDFAADTCIGWPFNISRAAPFFSVTSGARVRAVRTTGELLGNRIENFFKARFPHASLQSQYIVAEIGFISQMSCEYLPPRFFHPMPDVRIDILNADETGAGDILVSTRVGDVSIERYRVGDVGRILPGDSCRCGARVTIEVLGRRGYDFIKLAGAVLVRDECDRLAALCSDLFDDYNIEASEEPIGAALAGKLVLCVYTSKTGTKALRQEITRRYSENLFLTATNTLESLIRSGRFLPLEVIFVDTPFPSGHKDIKIKYR